MEVAILFRKCGREVCYGLRNGVFHLQVEALPLQGLTTAHDALDYKSTDTSYSTLKITKVTNDSIFIIANSMEISKKRKLYKIDKDENYNAERYGMSRNEYITSFKTNYFLDVDR